MMAPWLAARHRAPHPMKQAQHNWIKLLAKHVLQHSSRCSSLHVTRVRCALAVADVLHAVRLELSFLPDSTKHFCAKPLSKVLSSNALPL